MMILKQINKWNKKSKINNKKQSSNKILRTYY